MKTQIVRKGGAWIGSAVLLAGLAYSVLALNTQTVYASNCTDCASEQSEAELFCFETYSDGTLATFNCHPLATGYNFTCLADPRQVYVDSCVPD